MRLPNLSHERASFDAAQPDAVAERVSVRCRATHEADSPGRALVYVLPTHHPLRLAEEICMLDHLSHGRIEIGIGRGASPHELGYWGVDPDAAQAIYVEAYSVMMQALTRREVNFAGKHFQFTKVPIDLKPLQAPHPPLWYAVPVPEG